MADTKIIVIRRTLAESLISSLTFFGSLLACVGIGILMDSAALQWISGILWAFFTFVVAYKRQLGYDELTISQARKRLDELEAQNG